MNSVIKWLYGLSELPILLIGEGGSGKTSFLCHLLHGRAEFTIPTMGHYHTPLDYKKRTLSIWDTGMGCFRYPKWLDYFHTPDTSVLFFHDCTWDEEMTDQSLQTLSSIGTEMLAVGYRSCWVILNKQDSVSAPEADRLRKLYNKKLMDIFNDAANCRVIEYRVSTRTGEGVKQIIDDLYAFVTGAKKDSDQQSPNPQPSKQNQNHAPDYKTQIENEGAKDSLSMQEFWHLFLNADLLQWGHRDHLKSGYILILESLKEGGNAFDATQTFLNHLRRLRNAKPDSFRNTEHRTMTTFWLAHLHNAIIKYKVYGNKNEFPSWNDFQQVLLKTPILMNTSLWMDYYTKEHIFSSSARESWSLPDIKPLPGMASSNSLSNLIQENNPDRLLQYAFTVVQYSLVSGTRRGQIYFWIQIVHAAIKVFPTVPGASTEEKSILEIPASRLNSASFNALFDLKSSIWKEYYPERIWNSIAARMAFIPLDLKPLPNVIDVSSKSQEKASLLKQMESTLIQNDSGMPSLECLSFQAISTIRDADALIQSSEADSPVISSHSHLLLYLYRSLATEREDGNLGKTALDKSEEMSGPRVNSATHRIFWVQMFVAALSRGQSTSTDAPASRTETLRFENFIASNLQLVCEDLPRLYYSPEIWYSEEATQVMLAPDKRRMAGSVSSTGQETFDGMLHL
ncbi:unnamed protein product [Penicillium olsonii]|uniref:Uncharacterized protein n=1 Tax=Penicillium olsonii TaxID=99116 RepID=A0A9W4HT04_PENOL|nr:unnamed protein product [Penicillium olsonii]